MDIKKDLSVSTLLAYYGELLDEKAREILRQYYDFDMSLSEISENVGITRQGVRDAIVRHTESLHSFESALKLNQKFTEIDSLCKAALEQRVSANAAFLRIRNIIL